VFFWSIVETITFSVSLRRLTEKNSYTKLFLFRVSVGSCLLVTSFSNLSKLGDRILGTESALLLKITRVNQADSLFGAGGGHEPLTATVKI